MERPRVVGYATDASRPGILFQAAQGASIPVFGTLALWTIARINSYSALLCIFAIFVIGLGLGRLFFWATRLTSNDMVASICGFVIFSHVLFLADVLAPGPGLRIAAAALLPPALFGLWRAPRHPLRGSVPLVLVCALFTVAWNLDVLPRLELFRTTGVLDFWIDILFHTTHFANLAAPDSVGRGIMVMADFPRLLYHLASYTPVALVAPFLSSSLLDAAVVIWIPLGILIMALGIASLSTQLGGWRWGVAALLALALVPAPERLGLGNGLLGFAWLLETSPATAYSIGVSCAAVALLVRWSEEQDDRFLVPAGLLIAGCLFMRANVFVWLLPAAGLFVVAASRRLPPKRRLALPMAGVAALVAMLLYLSRAELRADATDFLFRYVDLTLLHQQPTHADAFYPALVSILGRPIAGAIGVGAILFGTLGPWLPLILIGASWVGWKGRLRVFDAFPLFLILVQTVAIVLAPISRNGDITEYRHRAGPFVVAICVVWTIDFIRRSLPAWRHVLSGRLWQVAFAAFAGLALVRLSLVIDDAKRPVMAWTSTFFGTRVSPDLIAVAEALRTADRPRRFVVANLPPEARNIDDAVRLSAFSGVPAYLSCYAFLQATGGAVAEEARKRLATVNAISAAPDIDSLRALMRQAGVTHVVVANANDLPFDPDRREALARSGDYAVYGLSGQ